jgi:hypothetical protein
MMNNEMITWEDLAQDEQEALGGGFPVRFEFAAAYWRNLESKGLVSLIRIDHRYGEVHLTAKGKALWDSLEATATAGQTTLTKQQIALMHIRAEELYPEPDVEDSRLLAIRDVRRLLQHITELESAAETTHNLWIAEKERYQSVYQELIDLQDELSCLKDKIRELSDVGNLFDGNDHLNEFTHEENYKLLEGAMDRIYAIVTGKPTGRAVWRFCDHHQCLCVHRP